MASFAYVDSAGVLHVKGTGGNDSIIVSRTSDKVSVKLVRTNVVDGYVDFERL